MNKEASSLLAKLVTEIYKNEQLQQKIKHLEEKEELHLNRIDELTDRVVELETNIDEAIESGKEQMKYLEAVKEFYSDEQDFKDMCFPIINSSWSYCNDIVKILGMSEQDE